MASSLSFGRASVLSLLAALASLVACSGEGDEPQATAGAGGAKVEAGAGGVAGQGGAAAGAPVAGQGPAGQAGKGGSAPPGGQAGQGGASGGPGGGAGGMAAGAAGKVSGVSCAVPMESPSQGSCADQLFGTTPAECNPLTNAGCDPGEVCEWSVFYGPSLCQARPSVSALCGACNGSVGPFCGPGLTCIDGVCAKLCCDDADCGAARCLPGEEGAEGLGALSPLRPPHCVECLEDADCKDPARPACGSNHQCLPVTGCCEANGLVSGCTDEGIMACVCEHEPSCCKDGWQEGCVQAVGKYGCAAPCPGTCVVDADCGPEMVCKWNQCRERCTSAADCNSEGGKCDPEGHCGECFSDADCSGDLPRCDPLLRLCVRCLSDAECPSEAPHCQPFSGCAQCLVDAECPSETPFCLFNGCSKGNTFCGSSADCKDPKNGLCDPILHLCKPKSVCCEGSAAVPGCPERPALEACVCAKSPSCCTGVWDSACDATALLLGCEGCAGGCDRDEDCHDPSKHACDAYAHTCKECSDAFDCKDPGKPVCYLNICQPTMGTLCAGDDPSDIADNYPAGAVVLTVPVGGTKSVSAHLCRAWGEPDYYRLVLGPNEALTAKATLSDGSTSVIELRDERGLLLGVDWTLPAQLTLTHLPAGTYYLSVRPLVTGAGQSMTAVTYSLEVARSTSAPCTSVADCAAEYEGQFLRASCDAGSGACVSLAGQGKLPDGDPCDSDDDCASRGCAVRSFTPKAHERAFCAPDCSFGKPCEAGQACAAFGNGYHCLDLCKSDLDCPLAPSPLVADGPWKRLSCDTASGKCSL